MATTGKPKYIKLTKAAIEQMFDQCNELYFNGEVERPIKFETFTPFKRVLGMARPIWQPKRKRYGGALHISRRYRWTQENLRKVVVHEMIHLYIKDYQKPLTFIQRLPLIGSFFIKQHDEEFLALMNELNEKYNLGITIKFKQMKQEFIR